MFLRAPFLRRAVPKDLAAMNAIWGDLQRDDEAFRKELKRVDHEVLVMDDVKGGIYGYVSMTAGAGEVYVDQIAVGPWVRGQGVGARLMGEVLKRAERVGSDVILEVKESNAKAMEFYGKWGFMEIGRRERYYPGGEAAIVMRRLRTFHVKP